MAELAEPRIIGFRRVPDGDACDFCLECEGAFSNTDSPMPLHNNCGCGAEAVYADSPPVDYHDVVPDGYTLDGNEESELGFYQARGMEVNRALRTNRVEEIGWGDTVREVDRSLRPLGRPVKVFRGTAGRPDAIPGLEGDLEGKTFVDAGYTSTAGNEWTAEQMADINARQQAGQEGASSTPITIWELEVDSGVEAISMDRALGEASYQLDELLLERGCRYVITRVEHEGRLRTRVFAKVLPGGS